MHIHHKDENKLNNTLSNLVYLTPGEHKILHAKGKHHSSEWNMKISNANKGKNTWSKGKHHSSEWNMKISNANKGKHYKNKGRPLSEEHKANLSLALKGNSKGTHWWHNSLGENIRSKDCPGEGWIKGRIIGTLGIFWWNNGEIRARSKVCPGEGWIKGKKLMKTRLEENLENANFA